MPKQKIYVIQRGGVCPNCGESRIHYGSPNDNGDITQWPFHCSNCGAQGFEEHVSKYVGTMLVDKGNRSETPANEYFDEGVEIEVKKPAKKKSQR